MRQIIHTIAILMLTLTVSAQLRDENNTLNRRQENLLQPATNYKGNVEPDVSKVAADFNDQGIKKTLKEHNFEAATELFRKAIEADSSCLTCRYNLGSSLINCERYDEAIKVFTNLISLKSDYANAYAGL